MGGEVDDAVGDQGADFAEGRRQALTFRFEINWADGQEGAALARLQIEAIRDVAMWVAEHPSQTIPKPDGPDTTELGSQDSNTEGSDSPRPGEDEP
jgi:hypothetical protein